VFSTDVVISLHWITQVQRCFFWRQTIRRWTNPPFGFPARGWMSLEAIPRTAIYEENNCCVPFNRLPRNFPGRSEQNGENFS